MLQNTGCLPHAVWHILEPVLPSGLCLPLLPPVPGPSPSLLTGNHWFILCICESAAFLLYSLVRCMFPIPPISDIIQCFFLCLTDFTWHNTLQVRTRCCRWQRFAIFYGLVVVRCIFVTPQLLYSFICWYPQGSLLRDWCDQQCTACPPLGRGALSYAPQAHDGPGPGGVSPAYGPLAPPRGLRQGGPSPAFCSSHRDEAVVERARSWVAGTPWASRWGPSQGCEGRHPQAGGLLTRDSPLLSALGGYPGFPETLDFECFPGSHRPRQGRTREAVHSPGWTRH